VAGIGVAGRIAPLAALIQLEGVFVVEFWGRVLVVFFQPAISGHQNFDLGSHRAPERVFGRSTGTNVVLQVDQVAGRADVDGLRFSRGGEPKLPGMAAKFSWKKLCNTQSREIANFSCLEGVSEAKLTKAAFFCPRQASA
jgi:hypothetical protein